MNDGTRSEWTATQHDARLSLRRKKRWWQRVRYEEQGLGTNVILEPGFLLRRVLGVLLVRRRRAILSMLPKSKRPFCVMIEGCDASKKWFTDLDEAAAMLVALI